MKNFCVKGIDGKEYWISRSSAVTAFVFKFVGNQICVLVNKRGEGVPDFKSHWNCPCGYLDFDETFAEATSREVYEETGIHIAPERFKFTSYQDDPVDSNKQNITLRFYTVLGPNEGNEFSTENSEENEVEEVKWLPIKDVTNYQFAFNHKKRIKETFKKHRFEICLKLIKYEVLDFLGKIRDMYFMTK